MAVALGMIFVLQLSGVLLFVAFMSMVLGTPVVTGVLGTVGLSAVFTMVQLLLAGLVFLVQNEFAEK